jgi:polysaccharide export outer membrane protein
MMLTVNVRLLFASAMLLAAITPAAAQGPAPAADPKRSSRPSEQPQAGVVGTVAATASILPAYVIGPSDVLSIVFWREKDMTADVLVRPDGNISLPLLNEIQAAGLTPAQLRERIVKEARRFLEDPSPTVVVKEIHSRQVFITGQVEKPGPYALTGSTTVLQLIAMAGGLKEFVDGKNIIVVRNENGSQQTYPFDYQDVVKRRYFRQNIELKPGDTVVVP